MGLLSFMTDPRELYGRTLAQTGAIIEGVRPDQLGLPTPCGDWDVRALLDHIVGAVEKVALAGEKMTLTGEKAALAGEGANPLGQPPSAGTDTGSGDDWTRAYRAAGERVAAAWKDDAALDAMIAAPWGMVPGRAALSGWTGELLAHGWDLAVATGWPSELDPGLAAFALDLYQRILPAEGREKTPFGPPLPSPENADVYARLAAWLGRTPPA